MNKLINRRPHLNQTSPNQKSPPELNAGKQMWSCLLLDVPAAEVRALEVQASVCVAATRSVTGYQAVSWSARPKQIAGADHKCWQMAPQPFHWQPLVVARERGEKTTHLEVFLEFFTVSKGKYFQNQLLKHGAERSKLLKLQPGRVCLTQKRICIYWDHHI